MEINSILCVISFTVFLLYTVLTVEFCGVPNSLSATFYLLNSKKPKLGYLFTVSMMLSALLLIGPWITLSEIVLPSLTVLPFLACAAICFVAAAPSFLSEATENRVHCISAGIAAVCSLLWIFIAYSEMWMLIVLSMLIILLYALICNKFKDNEVFWLEMMAFIPTYLTVTSGVLSQKLL